jgi:IS605 OrfB family transposase
MKLTVQLQLLPAEHTALLLSTMEAFNAAANHAARVGFDAGVVGQPAIHRRCYYELRERFGLSAQMAVRAIGKAVETFARDRKVCPVFKPHGGITYDSRILNWKDISHVSIWTLEGRKVFRYVYGEYQSERLGRLKGQVDLVYRGGKFYLHATIDMPEGTPVRPAEFVGVDLGVVNLATTSDGWRVSGAAVETVRQRNVLRRKRLAREATRQQKRGKRPRGVRRAQKRQGRQEARFRRHTNHCIAKHIVTLAKDTKRGIAVEDLRHIRARTRFAKAQRARMGGWAFAQLQGFLAYKARLRGVPLVTVDARYTSQTCNACGHRERKNRPDQASFVCTACGHSANADVNAAQNIAARALVVAPQGSETVARAA